MSVAPTNPAGQSWDSMALSLTKCFVGARSNASIPIACGTPKVAPYSVYVGSLGAGKVGDLVKIPAVNDEGPVTSGHSTVKIGSCDLARHGDSVLGYNGTKAYIATPATAESLRVFTGNSMKAELGQPATSPKEPTNPCSTPPSLADRMGESFSHAVSVLKNPFDNSPLPGAPEVHAVDFSGTLENTMQCGLASGLNQAARNSVQEIAAKSAMAAAQPTCLRAALTAGLSTGVATTPLTASGFGAPASGGLIAGAAGGTWLICTVGAGTLGSLITGGAWDAIKDFTSNIKLPETIGLKRYLLLDYDLDLSWDWQY